MILILIFCIFSTSFSRFSFLKLPFPLKIFQIRKSDSSVWLLNNICNYSGLLWHLTASLIPHRGRARFAIRLFRNPCPDREGGGQYRVLISYYHFQLSNLQEGVNYDHKLQANVERAWTESRKS